MKTNVTYEYSEEDIELLKKALPSNPCDRCGAGIGCVGCPEQRHYEEILLPYKEAGILDIALSLNKANNAINDCVNIIRNALDDYLYVPEELREELNVPRTEEEFFNIIRDKFIIKNKVIDKMKRLSELSK